MKFLPDLKNCHHKIPTTHMRLTIPIAQSDIEAPSSLRFAAPPRNVTYPPVKFPALPVGSTTVVPFAVKVRFAVGFAVGFEGKYGSATGFALSVSVDEPEP